MNPLDVPRGMQSSRSFDNLELANPRIQQLRQQDYNGRPYPGGRRGSEPFAPTPPRSVQNSPWIQRRAGPPILERQISKSAHSSPAPARRGLRSRESSFSDLRQSLAPLAPHSRRGSLAGSVQNSPLPPRSRLGSRDELQTPPRSRRGSRDELQTPPRSRRGSRDELQTPPRSRQGSRDELNTGSDDKTKDAVKVNSEEKSPKANGIDVEKNLGSPKSTTPPASPTSPTSPTSPRSINSSPSSKNCGIRSILKYLCVIVFLAGVGAIAFVIYQQVTKNDSKPSTNTTVASS